MTEDIDLSEIDKKYKDKCSLIKAGKCKNVNIFLQQSRENAELKVENERLKEAIDGLLNIQYTLADSCKKYSETLQEIKAIVETPKPFIDFSETKTAIEVEYDYVAICNELELRLHKVLELITKAEE